METIEIIAVVFGLICVWLTVRQNIWCWPTGLVMVSLYIFIFLEAKLYSDMLLQVVYVGLQFYGWHAWLHGGPDRSQLPVSRLAVRDVATWLAVCVAGTLALGGFMSHNTDASFPFPDAFTTTASLIAQWLMGRKKLESLAGVDHRRRGFDRAVLCERTVSDSRSVCGVSGARHAGVLRMEENAADAGVGMILGKFMPPHAGHEYAVHLGRNFTSRLHVLVCSLEGDPIPGQLRYDWARELFPDTNVVHIDADLPQEPADHPDFWNIWRTTIEQAVGEPIDYVFASEEYGHRLAVGAEAPDSFRSIWRAGRSRSPARTSAVTRSVTGGSSQSVSGRSS